MDLVTRTEEQQWHVVEGSAECKRNNIGCLLNIGGEGEGTGACFGMLMARLAG